MLQNGARLEGYAMKDDVPNLKDYSDRLRDEANMDLADLQAEQV